MDNSSISSSASIQETLSSVCAALKIQEEEFAIEKRKLSEEKKAFKKEKRAVYGNTEPSDVIPLNIGGNKTITVLRRTLTSIPGSMLASRFSGIWDDSLEKDRDGNFFIDQRFELFEPLINYLRDRANGTVLYPLPSPTFENAKDKIDFYRMLEYYSLTHGVYPTSLKIRHGSEDNVEQNSSWKVDAKEWTTFRLEKDDHYRHIKSYQIKIGSVQRIQIGWEYEKKDIPDYSQGNMLGVGDIKYTSAIDLTRSCFLFDGGNTAIQGLDLVEGTVIRSVNQGRELYVNDRLVASTSETNSDGVMLIPDPKDRWGEIKQDYRNAYYNDFSDADMHPVISVKGVFEVTLVEFIE